MSSSAHVKRTSLRADMEALKRGDLSLGNLLDCIQARFAASEPTVQAFLPEQNRFDRIRREARQLEARYRGAEERPPLYGAVLGVKDIFHVDGFVTRAGASLPPDLLTAEESAAVTALKRVGALILGKTVTTEFAYFEPGPTRNPHHTGHTPGGSSSGSAAAVASGLTHVSIGTQTVGSVIRPAAYCGIVGFKPSFGRVSCAGLVAFSPSADHVGFFTSDIADMQAVAASVIPDWTGADASSRPPRLGLPEGAYLEQSTALDIFEAQVNALEQAGFPVKRIPLLDDIDTIDGCHQDMIAAELAIQHRDWFPAHRELYRPRTAELIEYGRTISRERLEGARQRRLRFRERLRQIMAAEGIDLWICPAAPDVAPIGIDSTGSPKMNMPWTHAGMPALTTPAGRGMSGLPVGLQLVGHFGQDETLLAWAAQIEPLFKD